MSWPMRWMTSPLGLGRPGQGCGLAAKARERRVAQADGERVDPVKGGVQLGQGLQNEGGEARSMDLCSLEHLTKRSNR
jgi:hypothetical protein